MCQLTCSSYDLVNFNSVFAILDSDPKRIFLYSSYTGKTADYVIVNVHLHLKFYDLRQGCLKIDFRLCACARASVCTWNNFSLSKLSISGLLVSSFPCGSLVCSFEVTYTPCFNLLYRLWGWFQMRSLKSLASSKKAYVHFCRFWEALMPKTNTSGRLLEKRLDC